MEVNKHNHLTKVAVEEDRTRHSQKKKATENGNPNCVSVNNIAIGWLLTLITSVFMILLWD